MGNIASLIDLIGCTKDYRVINTSIAFNKNTGELATDIEGLEIKERIISGYSIVDSNLNELGAVLVISAPKDNTLGVVVNTKYDYIIVLEGEAYCRLFSELRFKGYKPINISINSSGPIINNLIIGGKRFVEIRQKLQEIK